MKTTTTIFAGRMLPVLVAALAMAVFTSAALAQNAPVTSRTGSNTIEARLQRVERQLKAQALVELLREVRALRREVQTLRGENEVLQHKMNQMRRSLDEQVARRIKELYADIDNRLGRGVAAAPGGGSGDAAAAAKAAYEAAVDQLQAGEFTAAIDALNGFMQQHSESPYAGNALYWLGEANYFEGRLEPAFAAYTKLIAKQPEHGKVPDANLKVAYILDDQGKTKEAVRALEAIIAHFAGTTVESQARQRLDDIRSR
ncbi:MAG: tol-pal system protein YbgF [Gammaproteobacteria bacterium]|nr:tol-pal system protein YbgF [Gammaproteobacteria bacterium]